MTEPEMDCKEPECPPTGHVLEADGVMVQLLRKKEDGKWEAFTSPDIRIILLNEFVSWMFSEAHPIVAKEQAKYEKYLINLPKIQTIAKKNKKLRALI